VTLNHTGRTVLCIATFRPYPNAPEFVQGDTYTIAEDLGTAGVRLWHGSDKVMVSARDEDNLELVGTWRGWVESQRNDRRANAGIELT
jgi:hypothetical protein